MNVISFSWLDALKSGLGINGGALYINDYINIYVIKRILSHLFNNAYIHGVNLFVFE